MHYLLSIRLYMRHSILHSLPLVTTLTRIRFLRWLAFRAMSPSVHWQDVSLVIPSITDPDITFIESHVVLGDATRLVAHSYTRLADGRGTYVTAPIRLKTRCIIGGSCLIEPGVTVGEDAMLEPCSRVPAFTQIQPGEVWGGNPAVFRRRRDEAAEVPAVETAASTPSDLIALVAQALGLPPQQITAESSAATIREWDSLGMMAIAAALHSRFGLSLAPEQMFKLRSVSAIQSLLVPTGLQTNAEEKVEPDFLPLMAPAAATALLSRQNEACHANAPRITVAIAASFVAEPLAPTLRLWSRALGFEVETQFASFNQIAQSLLTPDSLFHQNTTGINVVLTRPEDLPGGQTEAESLISALKIFAAKSTGLLVVADLPPKAGSEALRAWWREQISAIPGVRVLDFAALVAELGYEAAHDASLEAAPYSQALYQRLGIALARVVRATRVAAKKVIAVDADGTLWRGIVGEDGVEGVSVPPAFAAFQEKLAALRARGVLLVLASKNAEEDVWRVFAENPAMKLRREDFTKARINWQPKSANLREMAAELGLGLDSFVFIDDNPAERLEVAAHCPQVTILPGEPEQFASTLERLWLFDGAGESREDAARAQFQQQDAARQAASESGGDLQTYLKSLELEVAIHPASADDLPRLSQLSLKTNQFNTSLQRLALPELREMAQTHDVWAVSARDKFGDYGLIGGVVADRAAEVRTLPVFFMSCRALGRGVEAALLHVLARESGAALLRVPFTNGPRNEPAGAFLKKSGFLEKGGVFELSLARLPPLPEHLRLV
jgi:FkbH-like protein